MADAASYLDLVRDALTRVEQIEATELNARLSGQAREAKPLALLDVREAEETATGTLKGALTLPRGIVEKHVRDLLPELDAPVVVLCEAGHRSALTCDVLQKMGYRAVSSLRGGMLAWRAAGLPLVTGNESCAVPNAATGLSWADIRAEFPIVRRRVPVMGRGERALVYLDHAASTHTPSRVLERYSTFMADEYANIHRGTHLLSRKATERFDDCYYVASDFIGGDLERGCVVFLTNTTQAIDLASHVMAGVPGKVIVTELEHHSNDLPHRQRGPVLRVRVRPDGSLDMEQLEALLSGNEVKLVALTGASNVTGWMPDLHAVARLAHEHGARVLADCAQLLAHAPIDVRDPDHPEHIDFVAAAGHKAYAPFGASFLYGPRSLMDAAPPYLPGGGTASRVSKMGAEFVRSPDRHQGGTPNIGGVIAFAEAMRFLDEVGMERVREHERELTRAAFEGIRDLKGVTIYGPSDPDARLGVISFNVEGISDQLAAAVLSEEHALACRNGRFCAHVYVDRLLAQQGGYSAEPGASPGATRASFGIYNDMDDVARFVEGVSALCERRWVGSYRVKREGISAEFAGRCNDTWMESEQSAASQATHAPESAAFVFAQLNAAGPCKCYLVADKASGQAMIVDPRRDLVDHYIAELESRGLKLVYTIETHTHADHLSGSKRLKELTGCRMGMHHSAVAPCVDLHLHEGDSLTLGELEVKVWTMPGHTLDCVALLLPDRILTGDAVLLGASGRTDLGGDARLAFRSLQRLHSLPGEMQLWPGHDYKGRSHSTVAEQLASNPRLQIRDEAEFARVMEGLGLPQPDKLDEALAANRGCL